MPNFKKHHELAPHHRYQLEIIFLYVVGVFLFLPYYLVIQEFQLNKLVYQWYFFCPFIVLYTICALYLRNKVPNEEKTNPQKKHLLYWILLGLGVIFMQIQPVNLARMQALDLSFLVFSLFLADSYWDFKKLKIF